MPNSGQHSGITLLICPDPRNSTPPIGFGFPSARLGLGSGREAALTELALGLQSDQFPLLPHVVRCEAPPLVLTVAGLAALIAQNPTVLWGTRVLIVEGHSGCAGLRTACPDLDPDQAPYQRTLMLEGARLAADTLSTYRRQSTRVICRYARLDDFQEPATSTVVADVMGTEGRCTDAGLELPSGENVPLDWADPRLRTIHELAREEAKALAG